MSTRHLIIIAAFILAACGSAWLWRAKTRASRQQTTADIQRAKYEGMVRDYFRTDIESAKEQGKKEVILPGGIDLPTPELSLEELLRDYGLLRVKVIDQETTVYASVPEIPSADIETWYKVEIVETLHRQGKVSDEPPPFELPSRLLPLLPSESLLVESGGVINVLDIGENRRLKLAIFAAFFTFSVKLFEFAGLAQDWLTLSA